MNPDPFHRFLGVDRDASSFELLGLPIGPAEPFQIEQALHRRLQVVFNHPDGRSDDAEMVRKALRSAAEEIRETPASRSNPVFTQVQRSRSKAQAPIFNLTSFDRLVLAVLVGCGGWNATSRARLVALASAYGVSVAGLMRVVKGLGEYARSGGPRLGVNEIAGGSTGGLGESLGGFHAMSSLSPGAPLGKPLLDRAAEGLAVELERDGPMATIKLAVVFAVLTLIAAIVGLRLVLAGDKKQADQQLAEKVANEGGSNRTTRAIPNGSSVRPRQAPAKTRLVSFSSYPTFLGNGLPPQAIAAVDQCMALPAELDEMARKLSITAEPSEAVFRNWETSVQTIGIAWALVDVSTRRSVERAMFEVLREAADTPSVSDRLLLSIMPPATLSQPLDISRGCWASGTLATISNDSSLPPVVVQRARAQLELAIEKKAAEELRFNDAARIWLNRMVPSLVAAIEIDQTAYDTWELWLSAHRALGRNDQYDRSLAVAAQQIMETGTDLAQPGGASVNVLGRMVLLLAEDPTPATLDVIRNFYDNEKISSRDLWVFTTLLATSDKSNWFPDRMVLPEDADQAHRWRIRDDLAAIWPGGSVANQPQTQEGGLTLAINRDVAREWSTLCDSVMQEAVEDTPESRLQRLVRLSRLIEIAHAIDIQEDDHARHMMLQYMADAGQTTKPANSGAQPTKPGQSIGQDGEWATAYGQAGRNFEQRIDSLRTLRTTAGTDLGPIDAELFVRELYRGSPPDIRLVAHSVLTEQFAAGPVVAMELVDQLPGAPTTETLSQVIQDLTGESLPQTRDTDWQTKARLALVRHVLRLKSEKSTGIEAITDEIIDSCVEQLKLLRRERINTFAPATAQEAASLLMQGWADRSVLASSATPVPDTLAGLQRRQTIRMRLAEGPIQSFAAYQLSILDRLAYVVVAENPGLRESALTILRKDSGERNRLPGVLDQIVHVEQTKIRLWQLRFGGSESPPATESISSTEAP